MRQKRNSTLQLCQETTTHTVLESLRLFYLDISSLSDCSVSNSTSSSSSIESIRLDRIEFNEQCYKPILNQKGINVPPNETLTKSDAIPKAGYA